MKKICKILIIGILCLLNMSIVHADTLSSEPMPYYYQRIKGDTNFSDRLKILHFDKSYAYCVEPGAKIDTSYAVGSINNLSLNYSQKQKLMRIAHYGSKTITGLNDATHYAATQSLIWKAIMGEDTNVVFSTALFGKGDILNVSAEEQKIKNTIDKDSKTPSFTNVTYNIAAGEEVKLKDENNVLHDFYILDDGGTNAKIDGDTLVNTQKDYQNKTIVFKRKKYYGYTYKVYNSPDYQDLITDGDYDNLEYRLKFNVIPTYIDIFKTDDNGKPIENVIYGIFDADGKLVEKLKTDNWGYAKSSKLRYGFYYVKELNAPKGYIIDDTKYKVSMDKKNITLRLTNSKESESKQESKESIESTESKESRESKESQSESKVESESQKNIESKEESNQIVIENPKTYDSNSWLIVSFITEIILGFSFIKIYRTKFNK